MKTAKKFSQNSLKDRCCFSEQLLVSQEGLCSIGFASYKLRKCDVTNDKKIICTFIPNTGKGIFSGKDIGETLLNFTTPYRLSFKVVTPERIILLFKKKSRSNLFINLLNPTGHVMHQQFNIQQLYSLSTLYLCVFYLSENKQRLVPLTA